MMMSHQNWKKVPIKELYSGFWDGPHATPKEADSGPIYLGIKNISEDGHLDCSDIRHIAEEDFPRWIKRTEPKPGDIVFSYEATLNRYAIIPEGFRGCLGRRLALIRTNPEAVETKFLYYYFFGEEWRKTVSKWKISGATVDRLPIINFPEFEVHVPPLPIQRKIADVLSAYDDLIEVNARRIRVLEAMAQSVYREWFGKVDANSLPRGWEVKKLIDACDIVMGQSPASEFYNENGNGLPFHQGVTDFGDRFPTDRVYCTVENRIAEKGDVLFSVRAPVGRINIANKKIVIGRGVSAIRSKTGNQMFVFQQLKEQFQEVDMMGGGTIYKSVTKEDVHGIKFLLPTKEMINKFEEFANPIFQELEILTMKNANLRRTRDLLLPRLVSGEVEV